MKFKNEFDALVIVGAWNKNIFTPDWVAKFLLPGERIEAELPLNIDGSIRISTKKIRLFILGNKLNFTLIEKTDNNFEFIAELGLKIADYLPHTPVNSFGINLVFEENANEDLENLILINDIKKLEECELKATQTHIRRQFETSVGILNLSILKNADLFSFDFNFHNPIANLIELKEKLSNNSMIAYKKQAVKILQDVYNLNYKEALK